MGCALPARAPFDRELLGRGLPEAPDGSAGGPVGGWARVRIRYGCPCVRVCGQWVREYRRGKQACAQTDPLDELLARDPEARVPPVQK
eukprot:9253442-Alexandrium_andersonii.AAC.1